MAGARGSKNVISETVVSLSADIDNAGMQKLFGLMDTNRLKAYTLAASLAAVTTGVYKMIKGFADEAYEMQKLSKQRGKAIQQVVAEEKALKAMGKTLNEINKDERLKKTYNELVKFNKELTTPDYQRTIDTMNKLQTSIYKLKSVLSYALTEIGTKVFDNLSKPMDEVGEKIDKFTNWVKNNLRFITDRIAVTITDFVKGLKGIANLFTQVGGMLGKLPDSIKAIGLAIAAVWAIMKAGPLGQILAIVSLIGDIMHDYDNYGWNKRNLERDDKFYKADNEQGYTQDIEKALKDENGEPIVYQIPIAFDWIWDVTEGEGSTQDKARTLAQRITEGLTEILTNFRDELSKDSSSLHGLFFGEDSLIGKIFSGIGSYFSTEEGKKAADNLLTSFIRAIGEVLKDGGKFGSTLIQDFGDMVAGLFGSEGKNIWDNSKLKEVLNGENGVVNGFITALELDKLGASPLVSIIGGIFGGWTTERDEAIKEIYAKYHNGSTADMSIMEAWLEEDANAAKEVSDKTLGNVSDSITKTFEALLETVVGALNFTGDFAAKILVKLLTAIFGNESAIGTALEGMEGNSIFKGLSTAIVTWLTTGNGLVGILAGIGETFTSSATAEELEKDAQQFLDMINKIWLGVVDEAHPNGTGLKAFFVKLWEGSDGEGGIKSFFEGIGNKIVEWMTPAFDRLGEALAVALYNAFDSAGIIDICNYLGISVKNPNKSSISKDKNGKYVTDSEGNYTLESTNGKKIKITPEQLKVITDNGLLDQLYTNGEAIFGNAKSPFYGSKLFDESGAVSEYAQSWLNYLTRQKEIEDWGKYNADREKFNVQLHYGKSLASGNEPETESEYKEPEKKTDAEILELERVAKKMYDDLWTEEEIDEETGETKRTFDPDDSSKVREAIGDYVNAGGNTKRYSINQDGSISFNGKEDVIPALEIPSTVVPPNNVDAVGNSANAEAKKKIIHYPSVVDPPNGATKTYGAYGGRYDHETANMTIGEDGTEYLIPISKPERAFSLINQMLSEMGNGAIKRVMEGFGFGESGTFGATPSSMETALQGMTMTNNYNISAPVNINVNSSGANAKDIGTSIYDAAERHLMKTLRGVCV